MTATPAFDPAVHAYYTHQCDEATRLVSTPKGRLESARTRRLLSRFLPERPAGIVDIGGGAGHYASWLNDIGYTVRLVDPVERNVTRATASGVTAVQGDARELPFPDHTFNAALLAGPLYHLPRPTDRYQTLIEARRVTRPGGLVAVGALNRYGPLIGAAIANNLHARRSVVEDILATGYSPDNERLPGAYYHTPGDLGRELVNAGLTQVKVHGLGGPGAWLTVAIDRHHPDGDDHAETPHTLTDPNPVDTALLAAEIADEHPILTAFSPTLFAVARTPAWG